MFIKNTASKDVPLRSHEGLVFSVPPGVSAIWDSAGKELLKVHKIESSGGKDKYGFSNGHGIPCLSESTRAAWKKDGSKLARVERFKIPFKLIPRASLIKLALKRGISHNRVSEYQIDSMIDISEIANDINSLPVPEEIKYPEIENEQNQTDSKTE